MNAREREALFIQLAKANPDGIAAQEVYDFGKTQGDVVTPEAYFNLARRLSSRGMLAANRRDGRTYYKATTNAEEQWLDEEGLAKLANPDYPLIALSVVREASRQMNDVPEGIWIELRERLKGVEARTLFADAICGLCDDLIDEVQHLDVLKETGEVSGISTQKQSIETQIGTLKQLVRFGLGLSKEAVEIPVSIEALNKRIFDGTLPLYDRAILEQELVSRIEDGPFIREIDFSESNDQLFIGAVDGSTRSGLLTHEGEGTDLALGGFPQISVTTSVAQMNKDLRYEGRTYPLFTRLPERPEDMQQQQNRYTILAKLLYPDITEGEYIHLVTNAMDVLELRATSRVLGRWESSIGNVEVPPADIVFRDGALAPQDRDFTHYKQLDSYGRVVRDMIEETAKILRQIKETKQTVAGVVKQANLRVVSPVISWFVIDVLRTEPKTQIVSWPRSIMASVPDQIVISRLLTSGRVPKAKWTRSPVISRPFHAVTKFATSYSNQNSIADHILANATRAQAGTDEGMGNAEDNFYTSLQWTGERDPYVRLLRECWFSSFFVANVPRLDFANLLPRVEVMIPDSTAPNATPDLIVRSSHVDRAILGLRQQGMNVSNEHQMFDNSGRLDVVPSLISAVHDTVKIWATELMTRVNEVIDSYISRMLKGGKAKGVRSRPWKRKELLEWAHLLQRERDIKAGMRPPQLPGDHDAD